VNRPDAPNILIAIVIKDAVHVDARHSNALYLQRSLWPVYPTNDRLGLLHGHIGGTCSMTFVDNLHYSALFSASRLSVPTMTLHFLSQPYTGWPKK